MCEISLDTWTEINYFHKLTEDIVVEKAPGYLAVLKAGKVIEVTDEPQKQDTYWVYADFGIRVEIPPEKIKVYQITRTIIAKETPVEE